MEKYVYLFRKRTLKMELLFKPLSLSDQSTFGLVTYCKCILCIMYCCILVLVIVGLHYSGISLINVTVQYI